MRTQLENIERAEKYLNKELSATEHQAFEQELTSNPELKAITESLQNLQSAVFRSELRKKIESNSGGTNNWGKATIVGVLIITVSMLAWLFLATPNIDSSITEAPSLIDRISNTWNPSPSDSTDREADKQSIFQKVVSALDQSESSSVSPKFQLGGQELWSKPDIQSFQFQSVNGATIEGENGMLIIVPTHAFVDESGRQVTGKVEFNLVEALSIEEMVLYKLHTVSNGSTLESGGMFYLNASINGKSVQINPERPLYIEIPTTDKKDGMMTFEGEVKDGKMNWVNPKPLKKYLVKLPFEELDFLPFGFEDEVKANMPFLHYKLASNTLTDSLYYSLENLQIENKQTLPKRWNPRGETRGYDKTEVQCGIKPESIEAIKTDEYSNTFAATKEFEERIALLHRLSDGNNLLELYMSNLTKDLYLSDSMVALMVDDGSRETFERLAKENLTNVKDAPLYQKRLTDYYIQKRRELINARERLATQLATKTSKELNVLYEQAVGTTRTTNWIGNLPATLPAPTAATSNVYSTPWSTMGWANIDRYYKLLNNGTVETMIAVLNMPDNTSVTQWLGAINTYTGLFKSASGYRAVFPKNQTGTTKTHVFAIAESNNQYSWGIKHYDPYTERDVQFEMATASIADIKNDLRSVSANFGKLRQQMVWKEEQAKQAIIYQAQARKKREEWLRQREEMIAKYKSAARRQQEIQAVMNKLRKVAFPCQETEIRIVDEDVSVSEVDTLAQPQINEQAFYTIVEDMPQFPGGDAALLRFITDNVRYPKSALDKGITGVVYVSYVVDNTGGITDVRIVRSVNSELDEEALRVVRMLPSYTPGRQRGKAVPVQFTMPVRFVMN